MNYYLAKSYDLNKCFMSTIKISDEQILAASGGIFLYVKISEKTYSFIQYAIELNQRFSWDKV